MSTPRLSSQASSSHAPPVHRLVRTQRIGRPLDTVFAFFSDAANLEALTPSFLQFKILSPLPIKMAAGAQIDYTLRLFGVPVKWRTRIVAWEPGVKFIDEQERGPYALWRHTHTFTADGQETVMVDQVDYRLPLGFLGGIAHGLFVRQMLSRIFDYRNEATARLLETSTHTNAAD